jgi:tRNA modification GTPase
MALSWLLIFSLIFMMRTCFIKSFRSSYKPISQSLLSTPFATHQISHKNSELRSAVLDTIFALSSGPLSKTGVAVIRISGPDSRLCLESLISKESAKKAQKFPEPRVASLRRLYDPISQDTLDQALVLWFPGPKSFTGEDIVELHCHGGRAVILGVFTALETLGESLKDSKDSFSVNRIRAAERGEYTRRAFDNNRMDLTEVEGLADLLAADTSEQRKQALKQMDGYLRKFFEDWRQELLGCLAHTEAVIDFGDDDREDDVSDSTMYALLPRVQILRDEVAIHLRDGRRGELVRDGVRIALAGPPNAGKSSLMNSLARRPAAIVSPIAGTVRYSLLHT